MALPYGQISFRDFNLDRALPPSGQMDIVNAATAYGVSAADGYSMDEFWQAQVVFNTYTGCGRGNSVGSACSDASTANRIFYSNVGPFDFAEGAYVYVDLYPNPLIGYDYVYINGQVWTINNSFGYITSDPPQDC